MFLQYFSWKIGERKKPYLSTQCFEVASCSCCLAEGSPERLLQLQGQTGQEGGQLAGGQGGGTGHRGAITSCNQLMVVLETLHLQVGVQTCTLLLAGGCGEQDSSGDWHPGPLAGGCPPGKVQK